MRTFIHIESVLDPELGQGHDATYTLTTFPLHRNIENIKMCWWPHFIPNSFVKKILQTYCGETEFIQLYKNNKKGHSHKGFLEGIFRLTRKVWMQRGTVSEGWNMAGDTDCGRWVSFILHECVAKTKLSSNGCFKYVRLNKPASTEL